MQNLCWCPFCVLSGIFCCLILSSQQTTDSDQWVQRELGLAYKPGASQVTSLSFLHDRPPPCLCMCCISRVNMLAVIESLKVRCSPSRVGGSWGGRYKGGGGAGLNVSHSLGTVASAWPEGRSAGQMKTNPSLCCSGNRPESWRATEVPKRFGLQRRTEGWLEMKGNVCLCMCACVRVCLCLRGGGSGGGAGLMG